tara:strand:- start:120 stop:1169 length:1050 start_codon:yes stop_codon:yes gene_type:complete
MSHWSKRANIHNDVVFFEYISADNIVGDSPIFVWDLDKTYLDTHFESLSGLYRTIMEKAFQKKNVPGTRSLVRALTVRGESYYPIYFVSASPPQMEERILEKLRYDGIRPYGLFLKDNLKNLKPGRLRRLNQQVGFKLQALLSLRAKFPFSIQQILWGDDSESDAVIYSLYSDICARRLPEKSLRKILSHYHVRGEQMAVIMGLAEKVPEEDPVKRVYINLATDTDPEYYEKFGFRMLASYNSFQIALDLYQRGILNDEQVKRVTLDLIQNYGFSEEELAESYNDLIYRKILHAETVEKLDEILKSAAYIPLRHEASEEPISKEQYDKSFHIHSDDWIPPFIDYLHDFR